VTIAAIRREDSIGVHYRSDAKPAKDPLFHTSLSKHSTGNPD